MKKFNLEKAKVGAPIVTRDGKSARLLGEREHPNYPIIAVVKKSYDLEEVYSYTNDGHNNSKDETNNDLFMAPTKRIKYANFYFRSDGAYDFGKVYNDRSIAIRNISPDAESKYIKTIEIEWEE